MGSKQKYLPIKLENLSKAKVELCVILERNNENEDF